MMLDQNGNGFIEKQEMQIIMGETLLSEEVW